MLWLERPGLASSEAPVFLLGCSFLRCALMRWSRVSSALIVSVALVLPDASSMTGWISGIASGLNDRSKCSSTDSLLNRNGRVSWPWWVTCAMNVQRGRAVIALAGGSPPHSRAIRPAACAFSAVLIRCERLVVSAFSVCAGQPLGVLVEQEAADPVLRGLLQQRGEVPRARAVVGLDLIEEDVERRRVARAGCVRGPSRRAAGRRRAGSRRAGRVAPPAPGHASTILRSFIARAMS